MWVHQTYSKIDIQVVSRLMVLDSAGGQFPVTSDVLQGSPR